MSLAHPLAIPSIRPSGYAPLESEPEFDPARHLALEIPEQIISLKDLGYAQEDIADCPSDLGITSCFRILSDEGVSCLLDVARSLERYATSNPRIARNVRGGVYRSRFLRDLCLSPDFTRYDQLCLADPAHVVTAEYERHVAWLARERAQQIIDSPDFCDDRAASAARLTAIASELQNAVDMIRSGAEAEIEHFGDG